MRHNELRDFTASVLQEVCKDVALEPPLQPLSGEQLRRSANATQEARLVLPCHVTICIQKDGPRPGWICRYFAGVAERENSNPVFPAQAGKYRKLTTAAAAAAVTAAVI